MDTLIVSEKHCNKCNQIKSITDFHKCSRNKSGAQSKCKACMNGYYLSHQEKLIQRSRTWEDNNRTQKNETQKKWVQKNQEKRKQIIKKYYENNTDKVAKATKNWKNNNAGKITFYASQRRLIKKSAMPKWANLEKIKNVYDEAAKLRENGFDVHVDHIIPLKNKLVCGLHVHNNLQILDAKENLHKFNKFVIE